MQRLLKYKALSQFIAFKRLSRPYAVRPNKSCNSYSTEPPRACYNCPIDADTLSALHGMHPKHLLACTCRRTCIRCCHTGCYRVCLSAACPPPQDYVQMQPVFAGKLLALPTILLKGSHPAQQSICSVSVLSVIRRRYQCWYHCNYECCPALPGRHWRSRKPFAHVRESKQHRMLHMHCHNLMCRLQNSVALMTLCTQEAEIFVTRLVVQCVSEVLSTSKPLTTPCCLSAGVTEPHWGKLALISAETKTKETGEPLGF